MAIDASQLGRVPVNIETAPEVPRTAVVSSHSAPIEDASTADVAAALQQLQAAFSSAPNPELSVDYLSGLSVTTVRSVSTGEVVYQLPNTRVVELARLIKDGASLSSLGLDANA